MIASDGCMDIFENTGERCEEQFVAWHLCMAESDDIVTNPGESNCGFTTLVGECDELRAAAMSSTCGD
jgi:hypothetical protein